jgi:hypothetical protein
MVRKAYLLELLREARSTFWNEDVDLDLADRIDAVLADPRPHREVPYRAPRFDAARDAALYRRRLDGESYKAIAADVGLSAGRVNALCRREWKDEGEPETPYIRPFGQTPRRKAGRD